MNNLADILETETAERAIKTLLRPSESVTAFLHSQCDRVDDQNAYAPSGGGEGDCRVLAVIQNQDNLGGVLLLRPSTKSARWTHPFVVTHAFALISSFSISLSQAGAPARRTTVPFSPSTASTSHFVLTLKNEAGEAAGLRVGSQDLAQVRIVIDQCKAFIAKSPSASAGKYTWIRTYASQAPHLLSLPLRPVAPTLPTVPVHRSLSPLHAGMHRHDAEDAEDADLVLIAREWARRNVLNGTGCVRGKRRLRIRVGTFNVNGKMPTDDLSGWIKGTRPKRAARTTANFDTASTMSDLTLVEGQTTAPTPTRQSTTSSLPPLSIPDKIPANKEALLHCQPATGDPPPHLIVLGFQELDLSTEALIYSTTMIREDAWTDSVFSALGSGVDAHGVERDEYERAAAGRAEYEKVASKQLVGMLLMVFARRELLIKGEITRSSVQATAVGTGIMGLMGNKGAVAIRLTITPSIPPLPLSPLSPTSPTSPTTAASATRGPDTHPLTLTFINAHLAAFDEQASKRNAEFLDLGRRLIFGEGSYAHMPESPAVNKHGLLPEGCDALFRSDAVFWLGDLNYRIDLPDADVRQLLAPPTNGTADYDRRLRRLNNKALLRFDQLKNAMGTNVAFSSFEEGEITRLPTYRFAHGQLTDPLGYDLKRRPAWTDRVLHMASGQDGGVGATIQQTSYDGHPDIVMSDHRPVSAQFILEIPDIDLKKYEEGVRELYHQLGDFRGLKLRNHNIFADGGVDKVNDSRTTSEMLPKIRVGQRTVDFGKLGLARKVARTAELENIGVVACGFRFIPTEDGGSLHPDWLTIEPMTGMILPGASTTITFTAYVDNSSAATLNINPTTNLRETLILHTERGRDHFIELSGEYERTCFATTLQHLTRLPCAIRALDKKKLLKEEQAVNAPREIVRLVNWLMTNATNAADELFLKQGDHNLIDQIRECLDTGADFPSFADRSELDVALAFGSTLLELLDSLIEPVVPYDVQERCTKPTNRDEAFEILEDFPIASVNVWISVTAFLHYISQQASHESKSSGLTLSDRTTLMAAIFAPVLLKDPPVGTKPGTHRHRRSPSSSSSSSSSSTSSSESSDQRKEKAKSRKKSKRNQQQPSTPSTATPPLSPKTPKTPKTPTGLPTSGMVPVLPTVSPVAKRAFLLHFIE